MTLDDCRPCYAEEIEQVANMTSPPLATWIGALDLKSGDRVCDMGCGVGSYTAIMAEVVGPAGSAMVAAADGATFDPGGCDATLINAGVTHLRTLWLNRLREGGRLVAPLTIASTPRLGQGIMARIVRRTGGYSASVVTFSQIFSRRKSARSGNWKPRLRRDAHEQEESCLFHTPGMCLGSAPGDMRS
jgi:protein-L-isoaspartate O-methyltransferase